MTSYLLLALFSTLTAKELLDRCIAYHDPQGRWEQGAFEITEVSSRLDGTGRRTVLRFDNARNRFEMESSVEGRALKIVVENERVEVRLDDRAALSRDELERYRLTPAQVLTRRNFFLYLYGLPMKLRDPGTRLDPRAKETHFQGKAAYELRVTYDKSVGTDTWYFYLDRATSALIGHRFHHDESAGDGEYTVLSEEVSGQGLRLPRVRKWYRNKGNEFFITRVLRSPGRTAGAGAEHEVQHDGQKDRGHDAPQTAAFLEPDGQRSSLASGLTYRPRFPT